MTIDHTGREHRPAGSPASTGGQFAAQAAPAAAATLPEAQAEAASRALTAAGDQYRAAHERYLAASARYLAAQMRETGVDEIKLSAYHENGVGYVTSTDELDQQEWLDSVGGEAVNEILDNVDAEIDDYGYTLTLANLDQAATPPRQPYNERVKQRRDAMVRYATESFEDLRDSLRATWPDAHKLILDAEAHEWGETRYGLHAIERADGTVITGGNDEDMWELIEHRTGTENDRLRDLLCDIGEADAVTTGEPRRWIALDERHLFHDE